MQIKTFGHAGNAGDLLASLPTLKTFYEKSKKNNNPTKPILYLIKDHPAEYAEGVIHPIKDEEGRYVSLNQNMIDLLMPLLKEQPYLEDVRQINVDDESGAVQINLTRIRDANIDTSKGDLRRWYFYILPDLACNLANQYIFVPDTDKDFAKDKIILCRTERYLNHFFNEDGYSFLKEYEDRIIFSGTMREYNTFCMQFDLEIPKLNINNFLELAQALKQANGLISNQTFIFQLAEGLKTPRAVEIFKEAQNVIPVGEQAYDFLAQRGLEWYFHEFNGTTKEYLEKTREQRVDEMKNPAETGLKENETNQITH